jgi:hypothetical protein
MVHGSHSGSGGEQDDPLVQLFGTIESDVADIAEQHDVYIGQALAHKLRNHE